MMNYDAMIANIDLLVNAQPTTFADALATYQAAQTAFDTFDVNVIGGAAHAQLHDATARLKALAIDLRDAGDYS